MISLVVAMDRNGFIGRDQKLPWHLPADLQWFKSITMGKPIVMGRKTYESIGRALPGRSNIVISRRAEFRAGGCTVVSSLSEALDAAAEATEVMVIGGASVYAAALPLAQRIYLTRVHAVIGGDVRFPDISVNEWQEVRCEDRDPDERNPYRLSFVIMERVRRKAAAGER